MGGGCKGYGGSWQGFAVRVGGTKGLGDRRSSPINNQWYAKWVSKSSVCVQSTQLLCPTCCWQLCVSADLWCCWCAAAVEEDEPWGGRSDDSSDQDPVPGEACVGCGLRGWVRHVLGVQWVGGWVGWDGMGWGGVGGCAEVSIQCW